MTKWQNMQRFLTGFLETGRKYKAGAVYDAFTEEYGEVISRKDFEMFLRSEVMKSDGLLKRVSHGVYEIRQNPDDRGIMFARGKKPAEAPDFSEDALYSQYRIDPAKENLDNILDDALRLTARIRAVLEYAEDTPGLWATERKELVAIRNSTLKSMDSAVTGLTSALAWCEDHLDEDYAVQPDEALKQFQESIKAIKQKTSIVDYHHSPDFQCDQTEGYPVSLCVSWSEKKAWLELNPHLDNEGLDMARYEKCCADFGIRQCTDIEQFNQLLHQLGDEAYENACLPEDDEAEEPCLTM